MEAEAEEGEVVDGGVVGAVGAEEGGQLEDSAAVVLTACEEAEVAGCAAYVYIQWYKQLWGGDDIPNSEVDDSVAADEPAEGHVDALECGCGEVPGDAAGVGVSLVGLGDDAAQAFGESP